MRTLVVALLFALVELPNGWHIDTPQRPALTLGTLPVGMALAPGARDLAIVEAGGESGLRLIDTPTLSARWFASFSHPYVARPWEPSDIGPLAGGVTGRPVWDADARAFWVASSGGDSIAHVSRSGSIERIVHLGAGTYPIALAASPDHSLLAASELLANAVAIVRLNDLRVLGSVAVHARPGGLSWSDDGRTLYVALWGDRRIAAIDAVRLKVKAYADVGLHPESIAGSGRYRFVLSSDDDRVSTFDTQRNVVVASIHIDLFPGEPVGLSPSAAMYAPAMQRVYVVCSAANAVAVLDAHRPSLRLLGAIPTGWYPSDLAIDANRLYLLNAKGEGSAANPNFLPFAPGNNTRGYIGSSMRGSLRVMPIPSDAVLRHGLATVRRSTTKPNNQREPTLVRTGGPIRHIIYVIKENRTYDQVLGDLGIGDGDAQLALFGEQTTPNEHALARRFGDFDRFFTNGEVTADGLHWSTAAFANDYVERTWPADYFGRGMPYIYEDSDDVAEIAHGGYLWDAAARAGISYRNYGTWVSHSGGTGMPETTREQALKGHTDTAYRGFDIGVRDVDREAEWEREFRSFEARRALPALEILRLPNDHTAGTIPGERTPRAMVADNDLALGRMIDAVSHSPDWASTLMLVSEDDAQNGPDHVNEQRSTLFVVSPYAHAGVVHDRVTSVGVLHTIERILGIAPLSPYDALAPTLDGALHEPADLRPYDARPATSDLDARNTTASYRAGENLRYDWSKADAVPSAFLNDVILHAVERR